MLASLVQLIRIACLLLHGSSSGLYCHTIIWNTLGRSRRCNGSFWESSFSASQRQRHRLPYESACDASRLSAVSTITTTILSIYPTTSPSAAQSSHSGHKPSRYLAFLCRLRHRSSWSGRRGSLRQSPRHRSPGLRRFFLR